jgi:hypothetical protein
VFKKFKEFFLMGTLAPIAILWVWGAPIGAIISAANEDLLGVVLSIFIPLYGGYVAVASLINWIW